MRRAVLTVTALPRLLSYPPRHDYVDRLHGDAACLVHRDQPWPRLPDLYDPEWIGTHGPDWDVAHFHFTWEQYRPARLGRVLEVHERDHTPIVWTAHDLRNPHTSDVSHDGEYLERLAEKATAVVTLTPGAATVIAERYDRRARVIPHGPLVPVDEARALRLDSRTRGDRLEVLLLAKSLRANLDWRTPLHTVAALARDGVPIRLSVHLHSGAVQADEVLRLSRPPGIDIEVGERLPDHALWRRVADADVLLLPYRWGTHSGLLELATDLGTEVVVGDVGFVHQQAPCHLVRVDDRRLDGEHLGRVLRAIAAEERHVAPIPIAFRQRGLHEFQTQHADLYDRLSRDGTAVAR